MHHLRTLLRISLFTRLPGDWCAQGNLRSTALYSPFVQITLLWALIIKRIFTRTVLILPGFYLARDGWHYLAWNKTHYEELFQNNVD